MLKQWRQREWCDLLCMALVALIVLISAHRLQCVLQYQTGHDSAQMTTGIWKQKTEQREAVMVWKWREVVEQHHSERLGTIHLCQLVLKLVLLSSLDMS